jgi:tetratricopeptide (TPR) repeat protein
LRLESGGRTHLAVLGLLGLLTLSVFASSCAYYNTFYLAHRYYDRATGGLPYAVEKLPNAQVAGYTKAIDYSKKLIATYPKSKWVDDAYLLWARALLGKEDPIASLELLSDFSLRFPKSPLLPEALFYTGVASRQARKYAQAIPALDSFLVLAPKHQLAPYAYLERARALVSLGRPVEAAQSAGNVLENFPKSSLAPQARVARAEARLAGADYDGARADFQVLGTNAQSDDERFGYLLREADCYETAQDYPGALKLLTDALAHEKPPEHSVDGALIGNDYNRYAQLQIRIGTVHLLAGRTDQAFATYRLVAKDFARTPYASEAQYRIGYVYENSLDDFANARVEYAKVREHSMNSPFAVQALQRVGNLDRLALFRSAGRDTVEKQAEKGFLLAEHVLFNLDKPDRALEEYAKIAQDLRGTPWAAKAMNAQAWVLRNKLKRGTEADSILWNVVREYPATEAQIAARDYLEADHIAVPDSLIKFPAPKPPPIDTTARLTPPPAQVPLLGPRPGPVGIGAPSVLDSLARRAATSRPPGSIPGAPVDTTRQSVSPIPPGPPDSLHTMPNPFVPGGRDTVGRRP